MGQARSRCITIDVDDPRGQIGGMIDAAARGSIFKWYCVGCDRLAPIDLEQWLKRCGPRYSMLNQIDVSPKCGAPRFLNWSRGTATPYLPMKHEWLWLVREVSQDPDAWFEIRFMEAVETQTGRAARRNRT